MRINTSKKEELEREVEYWENILKRNYEEPVIFEVSFFKIFVRFEVFLIDIFTQYSIGNTSINDSVIERKLLFEDESHLNGILNNRNVSYGSYLDVTKIQNHSKYIFKRNPFDCIFSDSGISSQIIEMRIIRNHIAHESFSSKEKYIKTILHRSNYITAGEYLKHKNKKMNITNYSCYINTILNAKNILIDPIDYME